MPAQSCARAPAELDFEPLRVGARVIGFTPGMERDPSVRDRLYQAWIEHGVLLFTGICTIDAHLSLSRCFGDLEIHPVPEVRSELSPYLIEIGSTRSARRRTPTVYVFDVDQPRINRIAWHRDTAYTPDICKGAMLRMVEVPERHGETLFVDTAAAWDALPATLQRRVERLEFKATICTAHLKTIGRPGLFWSSVRVARDDEFPGNEALSRNDGKIDLAERYPSVVHPAVIIHPESGRKCLFISPTYVDQFLGMPQHESDALLATLTAHLIEPAHVYAHRWQRDEAIVWDNRRMLHAGMGNLPGDPRFGLRTTLAGPMRTGRYFDADATRLAPPLSD